MFSGIGGFELGINRAYELHHSEIARLAEGQNTQSVQGLQPNNQSGDGRQLPTCIGYSEIDNYAIQIYQSHFPTHQNYGDATTIIPEQLPDFELLVGGFPCQAFSIAGKRAGFNDTRGTLFFDIARILREKRPRNFVLENVKGLLSHDDGRTFKTIISTLAELGYGVEWQVLNSKNFGVPQNRERVFIVGHLGGFGGRQVFPLRGRNHTAARQRNEPVTAGTLSTKNQSGQCQFDGSTTLILQRARGNNEGGIKEIAPTLSTSDYANNNPVIINPKMLNFTPSDISVSITASSYKEPPVVLPAIRRLTPTECERLQGFPDNWTQGVSDTQRYKTLGNAVTVNVVQYVIQQLYATA